MTRVQCMPELRRVFGVHLHVAIPEIRRHHRRVPTPVVELELELHVFGGHRLRSCGAIEGGRFTLAEHLDAYWQSLTAKEVTATYRANALRAIRRLIDDLDLTKLSDLRRDKIEPWLSEAIAAGMSARTRNYYRDAGARFLNWCLDTGRVLGHDLNKLPKADERSDPRRKRRALTEVELNRVLAVAQVRPLADARISVPVGPRHICRRDLLNGMIREYYGVAA